MALPTQAVVARRKSIEESIVTLAFSEPKQASHTPCGGVMRVDASTFKFSCTANTIARCLDSIRENSFD